MNPTSSHLNSSLCDALNLNHRAVSRRNSLQARACWHRLREEINVHLIHGGEVFHVGEIDVILDDLLERRAGKLEDFLQVLENCSLLPRVISGREDQSDTGKKERRTVAALISPVAVWPAQKTRPGTLTAGPGTWIISSVLFR